MGGWFKSEVGSPGRLIEASRRQPTGTTANDKIIAPTGLRRYDPAR
jgi:hypothetical protein